LRAQAIGEPFGPLPVLYRVSGHAFTALAHGAHIEIASGGLREREKQMTRTNTFLISVVAMATMAFATAPAMASDGYSSVAALTGDPAAEQSTPSDGYSSVTALTGDPATERSVPPEGYSSVTSITGDPAADGIQPSPPAISAQDDGGFDWGDALIGAAVASGLLGLAFVGARSVARHRRATAEPRV
jgi:hypothetical protein